MTRRRLVLLTLLVGALLAVVAVAAHGRPLGGGGSGGGPGSSFFDYVYTSFVLLVGLCAAIVLWYLAANDPGARSRSRPRRHPLVTLVYLALSALLVWGASTSTFRRRLHLAVERLSLAQRSSRGQAAQGRAKPLPGGRDPRLRWDEVAIALAVLGALGVVVVGTRRRHAAGPSWRGASQAAVSAALDESLDDLRSEPDLRKAIIAAYARMERALAAVGLPRRPSEAPLEYVERALGELETSAGAVRRLADLFEWARFSQHEPRPAMRDEAIDALVTLRDELRSPAGEPVAA